MNSEVNHRYDCTSVVHQYTSTPALRVTNEKMNDVMMCGIFAQYFLEKSESENLKFIFYPV